MEERECKTTKENVGSHYEDQWSSYSEEDALCRVKNLSPVIDSIISPLKLEKNKKILDLGTGPAIIPIRLVQTKNYDLDIYGMDISKQALYLGRRVLENRHIETVSLLIGDCENIPFSEDTFDAVVSNATFNLLMDKKKGISEIERVLKSGGLIVMGDCITKEKKCVNDQDKKLWSQCVAGAPTKEEILNLAQKVGLKNTGIFNSTQNVKELVKSRLWDWPEFLEHDLEYYVFSFKKEP
jgi:ubiquinone/menaquinone biosynthesis C-methylase UbiE